MESQKSQSAKLRRRDERIIDQIQRIRAKNNAVWMDVVRLAMRLARRDARRLFSKIEANDRRISALTRKLGK